MAQQMAHHAFTHIHHVVFALAEIFVSQFIESLSDLIEDRDQRRLRIHQLLRNLFLDVLRKQRVFQNEQVGVRQRRV